MALLRSVRIHPCWSGLDIGIVLRAPGQIVADAAAAAAESIAVSAVEVSVAVLLRSSVSRQGHHPPNRAKAVPCLLHLEIVIDFESQSLCYSPYGCLWLSLDGGCRAHYLNCC